MPQTKDIAWAPITLCIGVGIAGIAIGAFLIAPAIKKAKAKKLAAKKKKGEKPTESSKKAA